MKRVRNLLVASLISVGAVLVGGAEVGPAAATTIGASSFAYELCGDTAFSNEDDDGVHVVLVFGSGAGPFGGGTYDCATGELTF
jgi:hypothetical protein